MTALTVVIIAVAAALVAGFIAFILFRLLRLLLKKYPIRLFRRDSLIRTGLLLIGGFSAYSFGANNIGSLIGPYITLHYFSETALFFTACLGIGVGFLLADKRVIKTISSGMFPLSPTEALIAVLASAQTLYNTPDSRDALRNSALFQPSSRNSDNEPHAPAAIFPAAA